MPTFDVVIKGGTVVDGTRLPRFRADVGIKDGRIAEIGTLRASDAASVLDGTDQIIAPGFIDLHTHLDGQIFWDPYATTGGWHGVTSVVLGNCGFGFAPVRRDAQDRAMLMMSRNEAIPFASLKAGMPWDWETYPEFLDSLDRIPKGVNCISYMPTTPLMAWVMGLDEAKSGRPATATETLEMQRLLDEALTAGACGWSAQRAGKNSAQGDHDGSPMPSDLMSDELCLALGETLGARGGGAIQITPNENDFEGVDEHDPTAALFTKLDYSQHRYQFLEQLAEVSKSAIIMNAIAAIRGMPQLHQAALAWLEDCHARGLRMIGQGLTFRPFMQYRLDNFNGGDHSPAWKAVFHGSTEEQLAKLANPELRARLIEDQALVEPVMAGGGGGFGNLTITDVGDSPDLKPLIGRSLGEVAEERGQTPLEAFLDVSIEGNLQVEVHLPSLIPGGVDADGTAEMMRSPHVVPGASDGGAHVKVTVGGTYGTDMLGWLVRDEGKLSLEEAHWHLSYLPAQTAGFRDRGFLREGAPADIVVYDLDGLRLVPENHYERVYDFPAGEWRMVQRSEGIRYTLVNGEVTFEDGNCSGATPGKLLRHGKG